VQRIDVARLDFPLLRSQADWQAGEVPASLRPAQESLLWSNHLVFIYPLWVGSMPALLKAFLEQTLRPNLVTPEGSGHWPRPFKGRSARVIVTMGMPALVYRWYFGAHSLKSLERNILGFTGVGPIHETLFGMVGEAGGEAKAARRLAKVRTLGQRAA
jgi:putative NADPH-quinone reductase